MLGSDWKSKVYLCVLSVFSVQFFFCFFSLIAGVKTHVCSSWVWSQASGGLWLCSAGSVTEYSVRCGHPSTFPTYIVHGELNTPQSSHCCLDCKKSSAVNALL